MKTLFSKITRFFWSRGFLKFVLWTVTLLILFYVEENWRGARVWSATKAKWEAKGESFDPNSYYPKPVPDDQNLAALPVFALEPETVDPSQYPPSALPISSHYVILSPLKLEAALDEDKHGGELPIYNRSADEIRTKIAAAFAKAFPGKIPPAGTLAQYEALYPVIPEIREASASRPLFRLNQDYATPVLFRSVGLIASPIKLSQRLALHAIIAMNENQPQVAMDDIRLGLRIAAGTGRDPTLVAGLVDIGVVAITRGVVDNLLQRHAFTDAQLVELQHEFAQINFFSQYKFTMRGEIVTASIPMFDYIKKTNLTNRAGLSLYGIFPGGWLDLDKSRLIDLVFDELAAFDPVMRRVSSDVDRRSKQAIDQMNDARWRFAPWSLFTRISSWPLINATHQFAVSQAHNDQDQIVCALERYHLVHGAYPKALDELAPAFIDKLPHDIMSGEPYRYQLKSDGTFLLYSVGWNQTDDGGKIVHMIVHKKTDSDYTDMYSEGDWPWPTTK